MRQLLATLLLAPLLAAAAPPLTLEARLPLGNIQGRIDHLALDPTRQRLYVAELGNNSIGVVDLPSGRVQALTGYDEPQGLGYSAATDTLYVANGGDGSVRMLRGDDLSPLGQIVVGPDADNVRVDDRAQRVYVGYGSGALAVIDTRTRQVVRTLSFSGHPESFQLAPGDPRIFVNIPGHHAIAVLDRASGRQVAGWSTGLLWSNFPMALEGADRVISVFRLPARVGVYQDGRQLQSLPVCGDSDDVFLDARRRRLYVICGQGAVAVFSQTDAGLARIGQVPTAKGARTGLFAPSTDRLYVAARAGAEPAALWVLRPMP